ncbi:hypothetical protein P280DRAFT_466230 [Massarina eburnea CBS 473.64]|uniref:DUF7053 domain-containing protein n=1 Tax=Massarina eburnea CBS 473.64 TaxID=1395130 RepID=A0A6A6SCH5_9PLEO|nr:hypothetical protein P280DRAFT_466230 [Massarina eburnea CBS 473.64]
MVMRKKTTYTNVTTIPSFIPRQLAIDILHSHGEIIELNPLVIGFEPIKAPRDAPADEFYATWYEISQRIQYIPGIGKLGSGNIKFNGCFHDMPWGLQTHTYAPAGVDLRNKWQICGNQIGEEPEPRELGIGAPPEGLYLREDIEIKCNVTMVSFVKKELKAASKVLVERLIKKAELLDAGVLSAMMENGKLKTVNPADRSSKAAPPPTSPRMPYNMPQSPRALAALPYQSQDHHYVPPTRQEGQNSVVMELPGDFYHPPPSPNHLQPHDSRYSTASDASGHSPNPSEGRWSQASNEYRSSVSSRPSSFASDGFRSPGLEQKGFSSELPTINDETREEHDNRKHRNARVEKYTYNPQDYARMNQNPVHPPHYTAYTPGR